MSGMHVLTLACRDQPGITAKVTSYLFDKGGNIIEAQQFNDIDVGDFFMRVAFDVSAAAADGDSHLPPGAKAVDYSLARDVVNPPAARDTQIIVIKARNFAQLECR